MIDLGMTFLSTTVILTEAFVREMVVVVVVGFKKKQIKEERKPTASFVQCLLKLRIRLCNSFSRQHCLNFGTGFKVQFELFVYDYTL